jgi:hypothetical protein
MSLVSPLVATSVQLVLGEYLNHIAFIRDKIHTDIREQARIGADVIAASSQYSIAAIDSLSEEDTPSNSLPVFALSRSALYGQIYLDNVDLVWKGDSIPSPGRYIASTMRRWNNNPLNKWFGSFDEERDYHELWTQLSEFVHIIPAIKKGGGAKFNQVKFDFERDLSKPTRHAGLPDRFEELAGECMEWQALLTIATVYEFRRKHRRFFEFRSTKVQNHLEETVFPDCIQSISGITSSEETAKGIRKLAKSIFSSST